MPRYDNITDWTAARIDNEGLEVFRGNVRGRLQANQTAYSEALKKHEALIRMTADLYGLNHKVTKYIRGATIPRPPNLHKEQTRLEASYKALVTRRANRERRRLNAEAAEAERRRKLAERRVKQADYFQRRAIAIASLMALGYQPGVDFPPTRAITVLKRLGGALNLPPQLTDGKG